MRGGVDPQAQVRDSKEDSCENANGIRRLLYVPLPGPWLAEDLGEGRRLEITGIS